MTQAIKNIGVILFNGIESLDFEGPLGVFGWACKLSKQTASIRFLSKDGRPVTDHLIGRELRADGQIKDAQQLDLLIVPGGDLSKFGQDQELVNAIRQVGISSRLIVSICTGAFLTAQTGLADGRMMTTHQDFKQNFEQRFAPRHITVADRRYVQDGNLWSSAGISAGIDMMFQFVIAEWGADLARQVQHFLEYYPEPPFPKSND